MYKKLAMPLSSFLVMNLLIGLTCPSLLGSTPKTPTPHAQRGEKTPSPTTQSPQETSNAVHLETSDVIQNYLDTLSVEQKKELFSRLQAQNDRGISNQKPRESVESTRLVTDLKFKKAIITQLIIGFVAGLCVGPEFEAGYLKVKEKCPCYYCRTNGDKGDAEMHDPIDTLATILGRLTSKEEVASWRKNHKEYERFKQQAEDRWRHSCHEYRIDEQNRAHQHRLNLGRSLFSLILTGASIYTPNNVKLSTLAATWAVGITLGAGFYHLFNP